MNNKPRKKEHSIRISRTDVLSYNQACDEWEAYHEQEIEKGVCYCKLCRLDGWEGCSKGDAQEEVIKLEAELKRVKEEHEVVLNSLPDVEEIVSIMAQFYNEIKYGNANHDGYKQAAKAIAERIGK